MIIAVDFDGILCENKFPDIGEPHYEIICLVMQLIDKGHEVILWTSRTGEELTTAVKWCEKRGLYFTEINENAPSNRAKYEAKYPQGTRKIYADVYIDDHNLEYIMYNTSTIVTPYEWLVSRLTKGVKEWRVEEN